MYDIPNINIQAMSVLAYATNNDAANIANTDTPGYMPRQTVTMPGPGRVDAVTQTTVPWSQNAPNIPNEAAGDNTPQREAVTVSSQYASADLTRDMTNLMVHQQGFQTNAVAARAVEQTTGTIFNAWT